MLEDVAVDGEVFDEDFVMYREDVDLAWRSQLLGWDAYYEPAAVGYHVRGFHLGHERRSMSRFLRRQSVRNGWLLLVKNETWSSLLRDSSYILPYQARIAAGLVTVEPTSLPALIDAIRLWPKMVAKRRLIQTRRRRNEAELDAWLV
jgi:hypothetical protein